MQSEKKFIIRHLDCDLCVNSNVITSASKTPTKKY